MEKTTKRLKEIGEELKGYIPKEETRLDERVAGKIETYLSEVLLPLLECESPIEKIFALDLYSCFNRSIYHHLSDIFEITHQQEIEINDDKKYRVDFLIEYANERTKKAYDFVIECDGHEFHQKTKEQVEYDKQRDRDLMNKGILVIRFTGSEIYNNPGKCAREAIRIIERFLQQYDK